MLVQAGSAPAGNPKRLRAIRRSSGVTVSPLIVESASEFGRDMRTTRRLISADIGLEPLRQVTRQRVDPQNGANRLETRHIWDGGFRNGSLDSGGIFSTYEKSPPTGGHVRREIGTLLPGKRSI